MPKIEGKTINQLLRVDEVNGSEIIPMSLYDETLNSYVTRGITVDDFFKLIYNRIQDAENAISYIDNDMTAYVTELREADLALHQEDTRLDNELQKTNVNVSYNAEGIVLMHQHYHELHSYSYQNIGELWDNTGEASSYAYIRVAELDNKIDDTKAYNIEYTDDAVNTAYETLDNSIQHSYAGLAYAISYAGIASHEELDILHAYAYENVASINKDIDSLSSYTYEGIANEHHTNELQNETLTLHGNAILRLDERISYESYVNTIQSGHINTIYYENSTDAFNDWSNPDDDNVKPQQ